MTIGGPDQETRLANAIVAPAAQDRGKFLRGQLAAALIEQNLS